MIRLFADGREVLSKEGTLKIEIHEDQGGASFTGTITVAGDVAGRDLIKGTDKQWHHAQVGDILMVWDGRELSVYGPLAVAMTETLVEALLPGACWSTGRTSTPKIACTRFSPVTATWRRHLP